ncbi:MAG: SDR family NAD(P)-dependent oxidoreductase [Spongiibacter marinus]|jgi:NAD(P)-dependent dehydrogenase (short-subunit alcohol dehydrogenase family)|uniref:SDR family NAD(P)-dependent oxidoreductase n=1 Tax=Spongiibacter marinus TaxID=354246 RepID=UPI003C5DAD87
MKTPPHCIISGGASGLGLGLALRLLERGYRLSILDLSFGESAKQQLSQAAASSAHWQAYTVDIRNAQACAEAAARAADNYGTIELAINCAGVILNCRFAEMTAEDFARVVEVNLCGSVHFARAVLPHMSAGSRLALVASMAGLVSNYGYAAYGASKFGVVGLATTLRYEYEPLGIGISCICPPEVETPMVESERQHGDPISLELKKFAGSLDTNTALNGIMRGLDTGRWMIIPGVRSRFTASLARYFPWLFNRVMQSMIRRLLHKGHHRSSP